MRPPTLTLSAVKASPTSGGGGGASGGGRRTEGKILQMLHALDDHDADKLIQEFKKFDADGNSELDRTEIREFFMEAFSYWVTEEEMDEFFAVADTDKSGTIDIPEFLALFEGKRDKRAFTAKSVVPAGVSAAASRIKSGLDALARIKRVRGGKGGGGGGDGRPRGGSISSISGDLLRRPSLLLAGPKIAYRHSNSTSPFDVGVCNMRLLRVASADDVEWLERRLAAAFQKAHLGDDNYSTARVKGHWIVNVTLRQAYSEQCRIGLPSR